MEWEPERTAGGRRSLGNQEREKGEIGKQIKSRPFRLAPAGNRKLKVWDAESLETPLSPRVKWG